MYFASSSMFENAALAFKFGSPCRAGYALQKQARRPGR
jgi:hypothetical protein